MANYNVETQSLGGTNISVLVATGDDITLQGLFDNANSTASSSRLVQTTGGYPFTYFGGSNRLQIGATTGDTDSLLTVEDEIFKLSTYTFKLYGTLRIGRESSNNRVSNNAIFIGRGLSTFRLEVFSTGSFEAYGSNVNLIQQMRINTGGSVIVRDSIISDCFACHDGDTSFGGGQSIIASDSKFIGEGGGLGFSASTLETSNLPTIALDGCEIVSFQSAIRVGSRLPMVIKDVTINVCQFHTLSHYINNVGGADVTFINPDFTTARPNNAHATDVIRVAFRYSLDVMDGEGVDVASPYVYITAENGTVYQGVLGATDNTALDLPSHTNTNGADDVLYNSITTGVSRVVYADHTVTIYKYGFLIKQFNVTVDQDINSLIPLNIDERITQSDEAIVAAYTTLDTPDHLYDYGKYFKRLSANILIPSRNEEILTRNGETIDFGDMGVIVDANATAPFAYNSSTNTVTIKSDMFNGEITSSGAVTTANGAVISGGTLVQIDDKIDTLLDRISTVTDKIDIGFERGAVERGDIRRKQVNIVPQEISFSPGETLTGAFGIRTTGTPVGTLHDHSSLTVTNFDETFTITLISIQASNSTLDIQATGISDIDFLAGFSLEIKYDLNKSVTLQFDDASYDSFSNSFTIGNLPNDLVNLDYETDFGVIPITFIFDGGSAITTEQRLLDNGASLTSARAEIATVNTAVTNVDADVAGVNLNVSSVNTNVLNATANITNARTDIATLSTAVANVDTDVASVNTAVASVATGVTNVNTNVTSVNTNVTSARTDIATVNTAVTNLDGDVATVNTNVTNVSTAVTAVDTAVTALTTAVSDVDADVATANTAITGVATTLAIVNTNVTDVETAVNNISFDNEPTLKELHTLSEEITTLENRLFENPTQRFSYLPATDPNLSSARGYELNDFGQIASGDSPIVTIYGTDFTITEVIGQSTSNVSSFAIVSPQFTFGSDLGFLAGFYIEVSIGSNRIELRFDDASSDALSTEVTFSNVPSWLSLPQIGDAFDGNTYVHITFHGGTDVSLQETAIDTNERSTITERNTGK